MDYSYLIFSGILIAFILVGVWIGHKLTLKAFAHVQPSAREMVKLQQNSVTTEPDPWEEAIEDKVEDGGKDPEMDKQFKDSGLPRNIIDPNKFFGVDTMGMGEEEFETEEEGVKR